MGAYCTSDYVGTENVRRTLDLGGSVKRRTTVTKMRALADESRAWLALKHETKKPRRDHREWYVTRRASAWSK